MRILFCLFVSLAGCTDRAVAIACTGACACTGTTCTCKMGATCSIGGTSADGGNADGGSSTGSPSDVTLDCQHMNNCNVDCTSNCTSHCAANTTCSGTCQSGVCSSSLGVLRSNSPLRQFTTLRLGRSSNGGAVACR